MFIKCIKSRKYILYTFSGSQTYMYTRGTASPNTFDGQPHGVLDLIASPYNKKI